MAHLGTLHEPLISYTYAIELPDGTHQIDRTLAYTEYHAMEKAYAKYSHLQGDRKKYLVKKPMLSLK